jgi:hypothetical protein
MHRKIKKYKSLTYLLKYFLHYPNLKIRDKTLRVIGLDKGSIMVLNNEEPLNVLADQYLGAY